MSKETMTAVALIAASMCACNKDATPTASGGAPAATNTPGSGATAKTPSGPVSVKGVAVKNTGPATPTFKSGADDSGGYYYNLTFDVANGAKKDIKNISYWLCIYDSTGKPRGRPISNGLEASIKASKTGPFTVSATKSDMADALVGLVINSIGFVDGTGWDEKMASCPDSVKP